MRLSSTMLVVTLGLLAIGCGGGGASVSLNAPRAYLGTQAPGDVWSWNITGNSFTTTNETKSFDYSGSKLDLPTGFMKLTIASSTDPNVTTGSAAYALEVPNTALLIKPAGNDTNPPIIATSLGANPAGPTVTYNFVNVPNPNWTYNDGGYGVATFSASGNQYDGALNVWKLNGAFASSQIVGFGCNGGRMSTQGNATGAMTPSGSFLLDFGPNQGGVIGVLQPSADVDLAQVASRSYRGLLVKQGKTECVEATSNGDGTMNGRGYAGGSGVETGTFSQGSGVTINFITQPQHGVVRIDLTNPGGTEHLVAAISQINGKYILYGFGGGVPNTADVPYNFLLVEK